MSAQRTDRASNQMNAWLHAADLLFGAEDLDEEAESELLEAGIEIDARDATVDPVQLERVLAVLRARRSTLAVEIADLARRRVELTRAGAATKSYLNTGASVPMH